MPWWRYVHHREGQEMRSCPQCMKLRRLRDVCFQARAHELSCSPLSGPAIWGSTEHHSLWHCMMVTAPTDSHGSNFHAMWQARRRGVALQPAALVQELVKAPSVLPPGCSLHRHQNPRCQQVRIPQQTCTTQREMCIKANSSNSRPRLKASMPTRLQCAGTRPMFHRVCMLFLVREYKALYCSR